ncbi:glycosyltransferase [Flavihumibacter profundi]|uniref:glycosyltransferase n=1 Tax=Flavihumibacter profundi TaxID=2716883 RepID=UPI001CC751FC|nr:glycosyltransferase [Flavihumibacter profundi]MBZ5858008.1 glycosyltransferase [Flavihumibacter profundi]
MRKKILVCIDWFDPAFKAGGPVRSCVNLVEALSPNFDFYIYTGAVDLGGSEPLPGILTDRWVLHHSGAHVWYASNLSKSRPVIKKIFQEIEPCVIYLNSVFSKRFTIDVILEALKIGFGGKILLAARGMLKPSALAIKPVKKRIFLQLARIMRIHEKIQFHASNQEEADEIKSVFHSAIVIVIPNLPATIRQSPSFLSKHQGSLKIVLVGRIHPIKNVLYAIRLLHNLSGQIQLDIIGTMEEEYYWSQCVEIIDKLPDHIIVNWLGEINPGRLPQEIEKYHLFLLPTKGENYGHAIIEALSLGRPVLISDRTPWRNLSAMDAGWDCNLEKPEEFITALKKALSWDQEAFNDCCQQALNYAIRTIDTRQLIQQYQNLFN